MGLEAKITYVAGVRFDVTVRGHTIVCDQPSENAGTDLGMTPPELLLASLGSCAAYYAIEYLRARNISTTGVSVAVTARKAQKPPRLTDFTIMLSIPDFIEQRNRDGVLRAVKACLIHNTLLHCPTIEIEIESKTLAPPQHGSECTGACSGIGTD
jgi:uncharacterized OsmC-like protein